ncbi:cryptochrome/photolyase family protein [Altererythrobacter sp. B11]|uniref:cryptochrome/photolyase family protein n=1 Tax=Altererythrobacter sp. B11 TaxID=2060312 RepID=UPI000E5BB6EB|nr:deoxyribodipyrimidine photo-lyase [Altererythrobacter sp. B11]
MAEPRIVWLRRDLRLADQPAFFAAAQAGPVIPVYVLDDDRPGDHRMGGAARWWLHHSLDALGRGLGRHHSRLVLRRGDCVEQLCRLAKETGAAAIHAIRHYEPWWQDAEKELAGRVSLCPHDGNYLAPPGAARTGGGEPYKIFTPFYKALQEHLPPRDPLPEPQLSRPESWPDSDTLEDWGLLPSHPDWARGFRHAWDVGEGAAHARLEEFLQSVADYETDRNLPSVDGSSRLSPHLHFGEISPAQLWHALSGHRGEGAASFRREIGWRDFAQNVICQFPDYPRRNYRQQFDRFPWRDPATDDAARHDLRAWQRGRTGYPIVDAGMRQLWTMGWMHNRVRMIAASFLIKHLLIDWRQGERWFWDTLVDADYGNNGTNWQWVSGTGVDSQMFGRIMAPLGQSEKFDAAGYIREWVPELADLPDGEIHDPEGLCRPRDYPAKLIGHREARERALAAAARIRD